MAVRPTTKITFDHEHVIQPIYTGGNASLAADGRVLATCVGEDVQLTDLQTGEFLGRIEGDGETLTSILITPSASHLVVCSRSLAMRIYSLEPSDDSNELDAELTKTIKLHITPVVSICVDHTGTLLATGSADGVIKVWDIRGAYVTHTFRGHAGVISSLKFVAASTQKSRDVGNQPVQGLSTNGIDASASYLLASGGEDGKIRIWDLVKRKAVAMLDSHVSVVRAIDFSPEHNTLLSGSRDQTIILWDVRTWKIRKVIPVLEAVESCGFVRAGDLIYTGGEKGVIRIWHTGTGQEITKDQEPAGEAEGIVQIQHLSALSYLFCVHADQMLVLRSLDPLNLITPESMIEPLPVIRRICGTHDEIIDLAYVSPDRRLLALATNSESIRLVSLQDTPSLEGSSQAGNYFGADAGLLRGHEEIILCLDVDWSGCWLATGAKDNTARLWRIDEANNSFECFATYTGHAESLGAVALPSKPPPANSPAFHEPLNHPPPFLITGSQDKTIKRWNITSPSPSHVENKPSRALFTRKAHDKDINAIAIDPHSKLFASASQDRLVKIWSVEEGEVQGVLRGHRRGVWSVKFAPKDIPSISGESGSVSSSRGIVLTGSGDKMVKIWSLSDYSCIRTFDGHTNSVLKVSWIPTPVTDSPGTSKARLLLASAGGDGLVKVWDASTGECICTLDNHTDRVWALACNPSTGHLVSGGGDGVITFWANTTATTAASAAAASTARVEQEQELLNHVHRGNYREAIVLALQLNHPARLLSLFTDVVKRHPPEVGSLSGVCAVDEVLGSLAEEQLYTLLLRLRDWNTNARTAPVAQRVLWVVMKSYPASRLVELRKNGRGLGEVLVALRAYTERHFRRTEDLVEESYLVDFVVRGMEEGGFVEDREVQANEKGLARSAPPNGVDIAMV